MRALTYLLAAAALFDVAAAQQRPLPTGRSIRPVGEKIALDTFPWQAIPVPAQGRDLVFVLHTGYRPPSIGVLDLSSRSIVQSVPLGDAGFAMAWDAARNRLYVAGGYQQLVHVLEWNGRALSMKDPLPVGGAMVASVALSPDGRLLAIVQPVQNVVSIVSSSDGSQVRRIEGLDRPTAALFSADGAGLFIAETGTPRVSRIDPRTGERAGPVTVAAGPADLLQRGDRVYVACANSDFVDVIEAPAGKPLRNVERWNLSLDRRQGTGVSPSRLALSGDAASLFVTLADANAIARVDAASGRLQALLPSGWYPTGVTPLSGERLLILNAKGFGSMPNPKGPNPTVHRTMTPQPPSEIEYTPLIQAGGAQLVTKINDWRRWTREARLLQDGSSQDRTGAIPKAIRHVIYIMKENRTYDQVLGDLEKGKGDSSLCLFPEKITPNHHALAREFVLLDNFYVNADVSAEGWHWSSAAIVPHFLMRSWPAAYAGRRKRVGPNDSPNPSREEPLTRPETGYLWTAALKKGVSFRNYGFFVQNRSGARPGDEIIESVSDPALKPHTNPKYAGYDPDFPDVERARVFIEELREWEKSGRMPQLVVMVLPNDHTWGTAPGKLTPYASMADNDLAFGRIVEAVSKSRFWANTAIFVLEDDAQNGPDHVDSHRAPAYVISPYTRRSAVDSSFYNTTSMLRTIEAILGLPAMTHYDAHAPLMDRVFQAKPDARPYEARPAQVPLDARNPNRAPDAASVQHDFSRPDAMDDREFNEMLWRALRGTEPPPPVRRVVLRRDR